MEVIIEVIIEVMIEMNMKIIFERCNYIFRLLNSQIFTALKNLDFTSDTTTELLKFRTELIKLCSSETVDDVDQIFLKQARENHSENSETLIGGRFCIVDVIFC